jgi:elongator complex protein 3
MLKIYPCLVTPGTQLYEDWKNGKYHPYSTIQAAELIAQVKQFIPPWVRIMRIQREIPVDDIADGVKNGNLRQLVQDELSQRAIFCRCIRCREVGRHSMKKESSPDPGSIQLCRIDYDASEGREVFLSYEDEVKDILIGYVRLRMPSTKVHRPEINNQNTALIRELHVLGQSVPVGSRIAGAYQHKGYGEKLLREAEKIAREEYNRTKMIVISALGTRGYYSRFGYGNDGPYVSKLLTMSN